MIRKAIWIAAVLTFTVMMAACGTSSQTDEQTETTVESQEATAEMEMYIGDQSVQVQWETNDAVNALKEKVQEETLIIDMSMYSDFEQVGELGFGLPANDKQIQTKAGDIMLYAGDKIVVFYGTNSWDYTPLGKIQDKSPEELAELLGNGDVSITLQDSMSSN